MMVWSINLLILSIGILIVGMIKPKWILFWMDQPARLAIIILSTALFMVAAVMFGEANKAKHLAAEKPTQQTVESQQTTAPAPVVEKVKPVENTVKQEQ